METSPIEEVAARLERLERQCRRWRWTGVALGLVLAAVKGDHHFNWPAYMVNKECVWISMTAASKRIRLSASTSEKSTGLIEPTSALTRIPGSDSCRRHHADRPRRQTSLSSRRRR